MNFFKKICIISIFFIDILFSSIQFTNLYKPYEWLFDSFRIGNIPDHKDCGIMAKVFFEQSLWVDGYVSEDEDCLINYDKRWRRKVNSLQYLQEYENGLTAFLGNENNENLGKFLQQYTINQGAFSNGIFKFTGKVSFSSLNIQLEKWLSNTIKIGYYVPVYNVKLKDICAENAHKEYVFESKITPDLLGFINKQGNLNLNSFSKTSLGDSLLILSWQDYFVEKRDFIDSVTCSLKTGLYLPTRDSTLLDDTILRLPFGHDALLGVYIAGALAADFCPYATLGISFDGIKLYGDIKKRRIKTDMRQTEILQMNKELCLLDPGFRQSFLVYTDFHDYDLSHNLTMGYHYNKQNESSLILCTDKFINNIAQSSQRFESWTTHSLVSYFQKQFESGFNAGLGFKYGFNGKRSLAATTFNINLEYMF